MTEFIILHSEIGATILTKGTHREYEFIEPKGADLELRRSQIAIESDVTLTVNGEAWLGFHCSPDNLDDLAAGFLYNESFIESADEISSITVCKSLDGVDIWLNHTCEKPVTWMRTSGCQGGVSQKTGTGLQKKIHTETYPVAEIQEQIKVFLTSLGQMGDLRNGVHSTMLLDGLEVISISNDIGRHNTLDKIAGDCLRGKKILVKPVLLTTGRISSDMVLKAYRMGVRLVISLHSISSLAIETGTTLVMCLIGHARSPKWGVYTHSEMIIEQ
jgi:FdhD protein